MSFCIGLAYRYTRVRFFRWLCFYFNYFSSRYTRLDILSRSADSPCTAKFSWRILLERLYSLNLLSVHDKMLLAHFKTTSCIENHSKIAMFSLYALRLLAHFRNCKTNKYFWRILWLRYNTFSVFSEFAKIVKNTQEQLHFQRCLSTMKGQ